MSYAAGMAIQSVDIDWVKIGPLIGAAAGFVVACLAALFTYMNAEVQKSLKRKDIYRLLKAEITNLQRHCKVSSKEILLRKVSDIASIKITKYKDGNMLLLDTKETYLLNDNICQDIMRVFLISRNNDIYIDEIVNDIRSDKAEASNINRRIAHIARRLETTSNIASEVLSNLDEYIKNPRSYKRPKIDKELPK